MFKKILEYIKKNKILLFVLAAGFFYRAYGIYFDYPLGVNSIWDETYNMSYAIDLLRYKSFALAQGPYPILLPLLYIPVLVLRIFYLMAAHSLSSFDALNNFITANGAGYIHIVSRWYSVFFGTATIFLVHRIASLVFKNRASGYFAAGAFAVSLAPVAMAHWGKAHTAMVFFFILSLLYALRYEEEKENKFLYFSALSAACSFSVHYLGIVSFVFLFVAWMHNRKRIDIKIFTKTFLTALAPLVVFFGLNIKGISYMAARDSSKILGNNFLGMFPSGNFERWYYVWRDSFMVEPIFIALLVILLIFSRKKMWENIYLRYVFFGLALSYVMMSTIFAAPLVIRWLLPFITLSIIISAGYFASFLGRLAIKPLTAHIILFAMLVPGAFFSYRWVMLLNSYTRNDVVSWLGGALKPNESAYSFDLYIDAPLSYDAAKWQKEKNLVVGSKKLDYITNHEAVYKNSGINLFYDIGFLRYDELGGENTKYIITSYWESGSKNKRYDLPTRKFSNEIIDNVKKYHSLTLEKTFYPSSDKKIIENGVDDFLNNPTDFRPLLSLQKSGPFVEIYRVIN